MSAMTQWESMSGWGKFGTVLDWLSVTILLTSFAYALIRGVQIPDVSWPAAFISFAFGRVLGDYDRKLRQFAESQKAALVEGD